MSGLNRLGGILMDATQPGMDHLDQFSFVETNVEDGDLSPLLELPSLRCVGTMDKKHYNYKSERINELLDQCFDSGNRTTG